MTTEIRHTDPFNVGIIPSKLEAAFQLLNREINNNHIPGAVALVGRRGYIAGSYSAGYAHPGDESGSKVNLETIYDVASLTKVVVTLPLILKLVDSGEVILDDLVSKYVPLFHKKKHSHITINQLLLHTSGLPSGLNIHPNSSASDIRSRIYDVDLEYTPGTDMVYSDVGFMLLGEIIEKVYGKQLDQLAVERIFRPLGMKDSYFNPPHYLKTSIAATEYREDLGDYQWGGVHDETASALGGVSGHAGLFSTAPDLAKYALMWLNEGECQEQRILSRAAVLSSIRNRTLHLANNRGLGWVLKDDGFDASGDLFSNASFGHTGFTGTSMWMDPVENLFVILLTNRVHFGRKVDIINIRKRFHNAVMASVI